MSDEELGTTTSNKREINELLRVRLRLNENHIKVVCRVRPTNRRETGLTLSPRTCVSVQESSETLQLHTKPDAKTFSFDYGKHPHPTIIYFVLFY
jgi:hypothetical protein